ncbi:MAG: GAF domain-containing protein [Bacteroidales bacterium]|nr:GAF domain-containing protein [Bacteroidales bacterium]
MIWDKVIKSPKILAFSSFFIILLLSFILIGKLINISQAIVADISTGGAYLTVLFIVIFSLVNLFLVMQLTAGSKTKEEYLQKTTDGLIDEADEAEDATSHEDVRGKEQVDIEEMERKIIPAGDKNIDTPRFTEGILIHSAEIFDIVQGLFYVRKNDIDTFTIASKFAYYGEEEPEDFELGVDLTGQAAKNQKVLNLTKIPENYITVLSGLGNGSPNGLLIAPVIHNEKTIGLIELASFKHFDKKSEEIFTQLSEKIGKRLAETL